LAFFAIALLAGTGFGLAQPPTSQIIARVSEQFEALQDYVVTLSAQIEVPNFRMPCKEVIVWYKKPDKFKFKSSGFLLMPKFRFLPGSSSFLSDSLDVRLVRTQQDDGITYYVVVAKPKPWVQQKNSPDLEIFVNSQRWTVDRIVIKSADIGMSEIRNVYFRLGDFWLPETTRVVFEMRGSIPAHETPDFNRFFVAPEYLKNNRGELLRGRMLITFANYRLNIGLSDEFFKEKNRE